MIIKGEFEVKLNPLENYAKAGGELKMGRLSIDKTFYGELAATSMGEMLSARTAVATSAGYVALEQVTGSLGGKKGRFALQHFGIMSAGKSRLILEVIPDSGEGELAGLSGSMEILIEGGKHFYTFEYQFAAARVDS
jgi:hypothetical protein